MSSNITNAILQYDGTFEGLMTVIFVCYEQGLTAAGITSGAANMRFDAEHRAIRTDTAKAERVINGVKSISEAAAFDVRAVFLTTIPEKDMLIYRFLLLLFKYKAPALDMLNKPEIVEFNEAAKRFTYECHRMHGFLRFCETEEGILYAPMYADHDILEHILPHFLDRLQCNPFMIHDVARQKIAACYSKQVRMMDIDDRLTIRLSGREVEIQSVWRKYFKHMAIDERVNKTRQCGFLPVRYRKYLPEFFDN